MLRELLIKWYKIGIGIWGVMERLTDLRIVRISQWS